MAICRELQNLLIIFREKSFLVMSLVKNICKDMIEKYKRDQINNVKFDGPLSPILVTMRPLKVCNVKIKNSVEMYDVILCLKNNDINKK